MEIYDGNKQDSCNRSSDRYLQINSCGVQNIENVTYLVRREQGRLDYHILLIAKGKCDADYRDGTYTLQEGDFILYYPHERQQYLFYSEYKTRSYWVHFAGTAVPEMLEQAGLADGGVYRTNRCQDITAVFQKLVLLFNLERRQSGLGLHGLFHSLLSVIADDLHGIKYDTSGKLAPALNQMLADYNKKIDIARYALLCNLSKSRFMHLFKEATGVSPYRYQLGIRIQRAEKLLLETGMSVSEIAASVGFDDPLYFSRIFKIFTGEAPRRYKRTE